MTYILRPLKRELLNDIFGRKFSIELEPGDIITFRQYRKRTRYSVSLYHVYVLAMYHTKNTKSIFVAVLLAMQVVAVLCQMCPCRLQAFEQRLIPVTSLEVSSQAPGFPRDCEICSNLKSLVTTTSKSPHQLVNPSCPEMVTGFLPLELRCITVAIFVPDFAPVLEAAVFQVFLE